MKSMFQEPIKYSLKKPKVMETKVKTKAPRRSKTNNYQVCVIVLFSKGDQNLRGYFILTDVEILRKVGESIKSQDSSTSDTLLANLLASLANRNLLSKVKGVDDTKYALVPQDNEAFQAFSDQISKYIGGFIGVKKFLERSDVRQSLIYIFIDITDVSKTKITGSYYKDGDVEITPAYILNQNTPANN
jgi:hypothetical protein